MVIHNLSAKKNKEDTVNLPMKNKINLLSVKSNSLPRSKGIKIKLETCKEGKKDQKNLEMKTLLTKSNIVESSKKGLSNSFVSSPHPFL